jgi:hypothetical protein
MRYILVVMLTLLSLAAIGQRIDFRNDSLFVNNYFIHNSTGKLTLDSLLQSKGKVRDRLSNHVYPGTDKRMRSETYTYSSKGLIFRRNKDHDTAQLSISIKLRRNQNWVADQNIMPTETFKGELFIDENYMNDKKTMSQLQKLKSCTVTYTEHMFSSGRTVAIFGNIQCRQRPIRLIFDIQVNEMTCVFID